MNEDVRRDQIQYPMLERQENGGATVQNHQCRDLESKSPIGQGHAPVCTQPLLKASEQLQDGGKAFIPSISIPFKSQAIAASLSGRVDLKKLQMEEKLILKNELAFVCRSKQA